MIKDLFKRERTFNKAILMSVLNVRSLWHFKGILKTRLSLKTFLGFNCLLEVMVLMVWMTWGSGGGEGSIDWKECMVLMKRVVGEGGGEWGGLCACELAVSQEVAVVQDRTVRLRLIDKSRESSWFGWRPSHLKRYGLFKKAAKLSTKGILLFRQYPFSHRCSWRRWRKRAGDNQLLPRVQHAIHQGDEVLFEDLRLLVFEVVNTGLRDQRGGGCDLFDAASRVAEGPASVHCHVPWPRAMVRRFSGWLEAQRGQDTYRMVMLLLLNSI